MIVVNFLTLNEKKKTNQTKWNTHPLKKTKQNKPKKSPNHLPVHNQGNMLLDLTHSSVLCVTIFVILPSAHQTFLAKKTSYEVQSQKLAVEIDQNC